jgi:lipopolysaccharide export system protein LptC
MQRAIAPPAPVLAVTERDRAFRTAKRHSRRVRVLRWALPASALTALALILLYVWVDPLRFYRNLPVEFASISISDDKLTIEAPKLSGFTQDRRPYSVTATSAAQHLKSPNLIELGGIHAQVELSNRGQTEMRAKSGLFDMKASSLDLTGGVETGASGGYKVTLDDARVEIRKGHVLTPNPVNAIFPDGTLQAQRLEIFDHGDRVRFEGVVLTFRLPAERPAAAAAREASR